MFNISTRKAALPFLLSAALLAGATAGCKITQTQEGKMPDVQVKGARFPSTRSRADGGDEDDHQGDQRPLRPYAEDQEEGNQGAGALHHAAEVDGMQEG